MKIVFLSHIDMNLYLFRLPVMTALVQEGHEVIALVPEGEYFKEFAAYGICAVAYSIDRSSLNPFKELKTIGVIASKLKELKPDIVHTFTIKPNIYGSIASRLAHIPKVFCSITGLGSFYIEDTFKTKIIRFLIECLSKIAFTIPTKIVFQNHDDLDLYVQKGIVPACKAVLIKGSGVDIDYFSRSMIDEAVIERYKHDLNLKDRIVVLMVARAIVHKGVKEYYQAAQQIIQAYPQVSFLFVGDVDHGNLSPITQDFLQSQTAVKWLGKRRDIKELMACCDIFVLPSYREGIPRTLLEAGSMGLPIVTTVAVGCKEVVEEGKNGFLVPIQDSKALEKAIIQLILDPDLRQKMGEYSRQKVKEEFATQSIVKLHLDLYGS